jgi:hypothetical protein
MLIIVVNAANSRRHRNIGRSIPLRSPIRTRPGPAFSNVGLPDHVREIKGSAAKRLRGWSGRA